MTPNEIRTRLRQLVESAITDAYFAGLQEGGIAPEEFTEDDAQAADDLIAEQFDFVSGFASAIAEGCDDKQTLYTRADLWVASINAAGQTGLNSAKENEMVEFQLVGEPTDESCATCTKLLGQRHRRKWVVAHGYEVKPGNANFECGCFRCPHNWRSV